MLPLIRPTTSPTAYVKIGDQIKKVNDLHDRNIKIEHVPSSDSLITSPSLIPSSFRSANTSVSSDTFDNDFDIAWTDRKEFNMDKSPTVKRTIKAHKTRSLSKNSQVQFSEKTQRIPSLFETERPDTSPSLQSPTFTFERSYNLVSPQNSKRKSSPKKPWQIHRRMNHEFRTRHSKRTKNSTFSTFESKNQKNENHECVQCGGKHRNESSLLCKKCLSYTSASKGWHDNPNNSSMVNGNDKVSEVCEEMKEALGDGISNRKIRRSHRHDELKRVHMNRLRLYKGVDKKTLDAYAPIVIQQSHVNHSKQAKERNRKHKKNPQIHKKRKKREISRKRPPWNNHVDRHIRSNLSSCNKKSNKTRRYFSLRHQKALVTFQSHCRRRIIQRQYRNLQQQERVLNWYREVFLNYSVESSLTKISFSRAVSAATSISRVWRGHQQRLKNQQLSINPRRWEMVPTAKISLSHDSTANTLLVNHFNIIPEQETSDLAVAYMATSNIGNRFEQVYD